MAATTVIPPAGIPGLIAKVQDAVLTYSVPVLLILIGFLVARILVQRGLNQLQEQMAERIRVKKDLPGESEKRLRTLFQIANKISIFLLWFIAILVFLKTINVDIGPIIAAAGVVGLAISFGSQELVKDVISGAFILFENQIRVGDVASINGKGGLVEEINLRTVVLRDMSGSVLIFRNGHINDLTNLTKDWSAAVFEIRVAYKEDIDNCIRVMREVAKELRADSVFGAHIIAEEEMMGVDAFGDSAVIIKMRIKTKPIQQWTVAREYRRRLKMAFDENNIEIPFPHRSLYFGEASPAFKALFKQEQEEEKALEPKDTLTVEDTGKRLS